MLRNFAAYASALAGYTDCPTVTGARTPRRDNAVARQEVAGMPGLVGGLCDRLAALVAAAKGVGMPRFRKVPGKDIVVPHSAWQNCY